MPSRRRSGRAQSRALRCASLAAAIGLCVVPAQLGLAQLTPPMAPAPGEPPAAPPPTGQVLDVQVREQAPGPRDALVRSSEAVNVVRLEVAKRRATDMGDVLSRTAGVMLTRSGGLGSYGRFSLNGLYDDQIRFFLDGVPLEFSGFTQGIVNIPVNLFDKVVVYRGVLPVRLGSDALGGAVNLLTDDRYETGAAASYQRSSFGTHRGTLSATYRHEPTGFVIRGGGYYDRARNNYPIDAPITDDSGATVIRKVKRGHERYRAYGMNLEAGVVDRPWAKALLLRAFNNSYDSELPSNRVGTVPYGGVVYGNDTRGGSLRYENTFARRFTLQAVANHTYRRIDFRDSSDFVYGWSGEILRPRLGPPGEIDGRQTDQTNRDRSGFGRVYVEYAVTPAQLVRASVTPTFVSRTGEERLLASPDARDPLSAKRDLFTMVSGIEYEANALARSGVREMPESERKADDYLLRNTLFAKSYLYVVNSQEVLPGGALQAADTKKHEFGVGDGLRYTITPYLQAKASYELTTRLPRVDEVFGNGVLIVQNLELKPETSHNVNIGPRVELRKTAMGDVASEVNLFMRDSRDLIFLLGTERYLTYQNVYKARSLGVEANAEWTSPGRYVGAMGGVTYVDQRNTADSGPFASTQGDRIPSRPWLTSFWSAQLHFEKLLLARDVLEPYYYGRYVHEFYRTWESLGTSESRTVVPTQVTHAIGVTYYVTLRQGKISATGEMQNLTDAKVYDLFGLQRPGRAYFLKVTGEI